eukprot:m.295219 g.295219  ORF g.295219 m.295219 type:complete len:520 (+) comp13135_c0_seq1:538-2097(+)
MASARRDLELQLLEHEAGSSSDAFGGDQLSAAPARSDGRPEPRELQIGSASWTQEYMREIVYGLALVIGCLFLAVLPLGLDFKGRALLCITLFALLSWTIRPFAMDSGWVGLVVLFVLPLVDLSFSETWIGASQSAVWQIFAGMVIGIAIRKTSLIVLVKQLLLRYSDTKFKFLFLCCVVGAVLVFLVPSSVVRVLILSPVSIELLTVFRVDTNSPSVSTAAVHLALCVSTVNTGASVLTSTAPNLIMADAYLDVTTKVLRWGPFLVRNIFGLWILQIFTIFIAVWVAFGRHDSCLPNFSQHRMRHLGSQKTPFNFSIKPREKLIFAILCLVVVVWATDFITGLDPVKASIGAVVLLTMPIFGPVDYSEIKKLNLSAMILIISVIGLGHSLSENDKIASFLDRTFRHLINSVESSFAKYYLTILSTSVLAWIMATGPTSSVAANVFIFDAGRVGLHPTSVAYCISAGLVGVFLPYQSAPILIAQSFNLFTVVQCFSVMAVNVLLLFVVVYPALVGIFLL